MILDLCESYEDIKHISICLYNLPWFLNKYLVNFVDKIESALLGKPQDGDKIKCTIKVLKLLNSPYWPFQNTTLIRSLLLDLQGCVQNISLYDMIQLQMV